MKKVFGMGWAALICAAACVPPPYQGSARDVKLKPHEEGVIAIPVNARDEDRAKAEARMTSNCGAGHYKVLEEGEVDVGQTTTGSGKETKRSSTSSSFFGLIAGDPGGKDTQSTQTTTSVKEWQITYKCLGASTP